jgi:hypothetical protein
MEEKAPVSESGRYNGKQKQDVREPWHWSVAGGV